LGSYTCNQPGYFTTMEGWLGEPAGNLAFAGEHTDSFHNFQGFIEGAAESGIREAEYLLSLHGYGLRPSSNIMRSMLPVPQLSPRRCRWSPANGVSPIHAAAVRRKPDTTSVEERSTA
jgi:hypothetical protein